MSILGKLPLTLKMTIITLLVGIATWGLLDPLHRSSMNSTFGKQEKERLDHEAYENRMLFEVYVDRYMKSAKILVSQSALQDYAASHAVEWVPTTAGKDRIKYYYEPPVWLPASSVIRTLPDMHYVFLLDKDNSIREVYMKYPEPPPGALLEPSALLLQLSHQQAFMTDMDNIPYLIASESLNDDNGNKMAALLVAGPLDNTFLRESQGAITSHKLVALVSIEPPVILSSSQPDILAPGMELRALEGSYLYTGKGFFDYGSSDLRMNFMTFLPARPYEDLSESILKEERRNRLITAMMLILSFSIVMYWVTKRVRNVMGKIEEFAQTKLDIKQPHMQKGDEIYVLEQRFHALSGEVLASQSSIKEQALMLRRERDMAQNYLDTAASIFLVTGPDHKVVLINRRACEILGYREEELIGRDWFETVIPAGSREDARANFQKFISNKIINDIYIESPVRTQKGEQRTIGWHNTLLKDEAGGIIGVLGSGEDVTDRRKAEEDLLQAHQILETRVMERTAELQETNALLKEEIAHRLLTESNLKKSEKQLERAQAIAHIGSWEWDIHSNKVSWSDEIYRIYGYQPGEIEPDYEAVKKAMHPDSIKAFLDAIDSALNGERPFDMEYSFLRRDGKVSILHTKGEVIRDSAGIPVKMFGVVQDITLRKRIEDTLKESERRFRETLTTINMITVQLDTNGDILFANELLSKLSGWEKDEIVGHNWMDIFVPAEIRDRIRSLHHDNCMSGTITDYYDNEIVLRNGQRRLITWSNSRLMDPEGNVIGITSIGADITERRLAEEKLLLALAYNRSLIEASLDPLVTISADGRITDVNTATEKVTGYSREKLIGTDFSEYFTNPEKAREGYQKVFREGTVYDYALEISHRKGHTTPVLYNASVYSNESGEVIGVFAAARDITERKRMEDRIRASLKEKEVLLQEIHHRVKNNMTVISSLLKLQADKVKDEYYKELFSESINRIKTMALIHEKLYRSDDLARIVFSDYLKDMIDNIVGSYGINTRRVHLKKELEKVILPLDTSIPCGLIVNELLSNSLKYAYPEGSSGEIRVSLRKNNDKVELSVGDDGVGLPADMDFRTTGSLGLNIVNALVRQIRGNIELHRERGTEFNITFGSDN